MMTSDLLESCKQKLGILKILIFLILDTLHRNIVNILSVISSLAIPM